VLTYELVCGHEPFGSADQGNTGELDRVDKSDDSDTISNMSSGRALP
jgi:hypothetical protein